MTPRADVVVVGAGIVGCSVAWHLATRHDARVLVLDRTGVGSGMTGLQPGGLRTQWSSPTTRTLALESRAFYDAISEHLGMPVDLGFQPCGYLFVADTQQTADELARDAENQRADGVEIDVLDAAAVAEMVPSLPAEAVAGATFGPTDGYLDHPGAPVAAFAAAAERAGVTFQQAEVTQVADDGDRPHLETSTGTILADRVVIAAGADTPGLLSERAAAPPVEWSPKTLFYSNPIPGRLFEPLAVFVDRGLAVKHLADGTVLASDLHLGAVAAGDEARERQRLRHMVTDAIPLMEHVRYPVHVQGRYDVTPDNQAVVGAVDAGQRLWVACGMNGRGMMTAPAIGRLVADGMAIAEDVVPDDLRPRRFDRDEATRPEARVI